MADVRHTPGPWTWRVRYDAKQLVGEAGNCVLYGFQHHNGTRDIEVSEGDQRLIAAAPDMLAALQAILLIPIGDRERLASSLADARVVFAKARGEP